MRASKAKTEIRQGQIAQAALKLMAVRGWRRVNLAAIAKKVGIVPSDVYRHYTGKDQVLDAVLDLVDQRFQTNLKVARQKTTDPVACLHEVLKRHVQLIHGGIPVPASSCPKTYSPDDHGTANEFKRSTETILARLLRSSRTANSRISFVGSWLLKPSQ